MSRSVHFTENETYAMMEGMVDNYQTLYMPQRPGGPTEKDKSASWAEIAER